MTDIRAFSLGANRSLSAVRQYKLPLCLWQFLGRVLIARATLEDALPMLPFDSYSATEFKSGSSSNVKTNLSLTTCRGR